MEPQRTGVAFSVDAEAFCAFIRSLPNGIPHPDGAALSAADLVDFDQCWAIDLADPWGNRYELNCYEHDAVRLTLVDADRLTPVRYWPPDLIGTWQRRPA